MLSLRGGETVRKCSCLIIELCGNGERYGFQEEKIVERLKSWGFNPYRYDPFNRKLQIEDQISYTGNVIFIRDEHCILRRIKKAPIIEINGFRY